MPTTKHRINITPTKAVEDILKLSAKRDRMSVSGKALKLIEEALEREEDLLWAEVIKQRTTKKIKLLTHKQVWR